MGVGTPFGLGNFTFLHCFCVCENHAQRASHFIPFLCASRRQDLDYEVQSTLARCWQGLDERQSGERERERTHMKEELTFVRDFCMLGVLHT